MSKTIEILSDLKYKTVIKMGPSWFRNMRLNAPDVVDGFEKVGLDIVDKSDRQTAFVFAPGASLTQYEGRIHEIDGVIIATPTAVPWLLDQNLRPDFVVIVDSHPKMAQLLTEYDGPLVVPTTVDHAVVELPNKKYWFKLLFGSTGQADDPEFGQMNFMIHKMWDNIEKGFVSLGSVTNMAVQITFHLMAEHIIQAKRMVLMGADYSYWNDLGRVPNDGKKAPARPLDIDACVYRGKHTNVRMVYYLWGLYRLLKSIYLPIFSMSEGTLTEIPYVSFEDILANNYPQELTLEELQAKMEAALKEFFDTLPSLVEEA